MQSNVEESKDLNKCLNLYKPIQCEATYAQKSKSFCKCLKL